MFSAKYENAFNLSERHNLRKKDDVVVFFFSDWFLPWEFSGCKLESWFTLTITGDLNRRKVDPFYLLAPVIRRLCCALPGNFMDASSRCTCPHYQAVGSSACGFCGRSLPPEWPVSELRLSELAWSFRDTLRVAIAGLVGAFVGLFVVGNWKTQPFHLSFSFDLIHLQCRTLCSWKKFESTFIQFYQFLWMMKNLEHETSSKKKGSFSDPDHWKCLCNLRVALPSS